MFLLFLVLATKKIQTFATCFQRDFYTLAELQKIPPPQGVDPAKLENYLSDSDFKVRLDFLGVIVLVFAWTKSHCLARNEKQSEVSNYRGITLKRIPLN